MYEVHGLHKRLSERCTLLWLWEAGGWRTKNYFQELLPYLARRGVGRDRVFSELHGGLGRLPTRSNADGSWDRVRDNLPGSQVVAIISGQRSGVLSLCVKVIRQYKKGGLGIFALLFYLDRLERS